jgi:hypothetical protein
VDGFEGFVGKLRGQSGLEASAEFFERQLARRPLKISADKFQTVRARAAKA